MDKKIRDVYGYAASYSERQYRQVKKLYDEEIANSAKLKNTISEYQTKLFDILVLNSRLLAALALASEHVDDKHKERIEQTLEECLKEVKEVV